MWACVMLARVRTPMEKHPLHQSERERERERKREYLIFKGMTGALAPFSYLVRHVHQLKKLRNKYQM